MLFVLKHRLLNLDMPINRNTAMLQIPLNASEMLSYRIFCEIISVHQRYKSTNLHLTNTLYEYLFLCGSANFVLGWLRSLMKLYDILIFILPEVR